MPGGSWRVAISARVCSAPGFVSVSPLPAREIESRRRVLLGLREPAGLARAPAVQMGTIGWPKNPIPPRHLGHRSCQERKSGVQIPDHREGATEARRDAWPVKRDAPLAQGHRLLEERNCVFGVAPGEMHARETIGGPHALERSADRLGDPRALAAPRKRLGEVAGPGQAKSEPRPARRGRQQGAAAEALVERDILERPRDPAHPLYRPGQVAPPKIDAPRPMLVQTCSARSPRDIAIGERARPCWIAPAKSPSDPSK